LLPSVTQLLLDTARGTSQAGEEPEPAESKKGISTSTSTAVDPKKDGEAVLIGRLQST